MFDYIVPLIFIVVIVFGLIKKVNCYDAFVLGAKQSFPLALDIFPYVASMFMVIELMRVSGVDNYLVQFLTPVFNFAGIPTELIELCILRPFTGSGSLALLKEIYVKYGVDTYVGRCASIIMGSTETVFYVASVYFCKSKVNKLGFALPIAIFCSTVGCILACLLCKIM